MVLCDAHRLPAVQYCEGCSEFLCELFEDAGAHAAHRTCSTQRAFRLLHDEGDACARRLHELHTQTAQSRAQTANRRGAEACVPDAIEEGMLALFAEVERKLSALKEECMRKYWGEKEKLRVAKGGAQERSKLREMERSLHQLQSCLGDERCDTKKLRQECRAARALVQRVEASPAASGQRGGAQTRSGAGASPLAARVGAVGVEAKRDSLASEFLHELQHALLPAMVCPCVPGCWWPHGAHILLRSVCFLSSLGIFPRFYFLSYTSLL